MAERPDAPYFTHLQKFERGLIEFTLTQTDHDVEWSASLLGVSVKFLRDRCAKLDVLIAQPLAAVTSDGSAVSRTVSDKPPKAAPKPAKPKPQLRVVNDEPNDDAANDVDDVDDGDDDDDIEEEIKAARDDDGSEDDDATDDDVADDDDDVEEAKPRPGRRATVSNDPNLLTRKDVELMLGLSTASVLSLRTKGQLPSVWNDEYGSYLFPRDAVEALAKERAEQRDRKRRAEREENER